jgi:hypothetical protein
VRDSFAFRQFVCRDVSAETSRSHNELRVAAVWSLEGTASDVPAGTRDRSLIVYVVRCNDKLTAE